MGKWADEAFDRLKKKEGVEHEGRQIDALHRQQVVAEAPLLWKQLVSTIRQEVADFLTKRPSYLSQTYAELSEGPILTVGTPDQRLDLTFEQTFPRITCEVQSTKSPTGKETTGVGAFRFAVREGQVWLYDEATLEKTTVPALATRLLNLLV